MTTARNTLLNELLAGEDPASPEYADARTRLEGLIADHRNEVLDEIREGASVDLVAEHRDQVLAEEATSARTAAEALPDGDPLIPGLLHSASLLLAARTGKEGSPTPAPADRLREAIRDATVSLETLHDRLVFEHADVADTLQNLIDRLNRTGQEG